MSLRYQRYDLVWEEDGRLVGYKQVVDCGVDADAVPDEVRRCLMKNSGAEFLQPRPALKKPMDLVWGEGDGLVGYKEVISSRLDPEKLPMSLSNFVRPSAVTSAQPHTYLTLLDNVNPSYSATSKQIGYKVTEQPHAKHDPTQTWTGLQGKFTSTFPTAPGRSGSLNTTMDKHPAMKGPSFAATPYFEPRIT
eukprot:TRINITY_DN11578_c0_g1_i1.p1 TRINITY_DN11578_c0_g1~~TRINITY_DN11578_c0_g1_i1.p1  ORF type:complete len:206 (+),score=40.23 TRINITY_DN11578_c0_g1_i1:43-618(+)